MDKITSEQTFETAIIKSLVELGGYIEGDARDYCPELGMFKCGVLDFLKDTQPDNWEKLSTVHGADIDMRVIQRLYKEMDLRGSLDVLRNGFADYGIRFKMAFFKPESGLNPETQELYDKNRLCVIRQLYYSMKNKNSVDLVISLNGIPVATIELKNQFTGQTVDNAKRQYARTRDNQELLFAFKKRALVHFAVDPDEVFMTTRIEKKNIKWLPFNKGFNNGAGNPPNPNGYKTSYLWQEALAKESLMEIIQRFVHLQTDKIEIEGKTIKKEKLIFPRYHQLDTVLSSFSITILSQILQLHF